MELEKFNKDYDIIIGRYEKLPNMKRLPEFLRFSYGISFDKNVIKKASKIIQHKTINQPQANELYDNVPDDIFLFIYNNEQNINLDFFEFNSLDSRVKYVIEENLKTTNITPLVKGKINLLNLHTILLSINIRIERDLDENLFHIIDDTKLNFEDYITRFNKNGHIKSMNNDSFTFTFYNKVELDGYNLTRYDSNDISKIDFRTSVTGKEIQDDINLIPIYEDKDRLMFYMLNEKDAKLNFIDYQRIENFLKYYKINFDWFNNGKFNLAFEDRIIMKEKLTVDSIKYFISRSFSFSKQI